MKKVQYFLFAAIVALSACKGSGDKPGTSGSDTTQTVTELTTGSGVDAITKRYGIKSGVVVYKGPMGVIQTLYFDNFGAMEVFTTEMDMGGITVKDTQIRRDGHQYSFKSDETTGTKTKWYVNDTRYSEMDAETIARYKVKKMGNENVAGKNCEKYYAEFGSSPITSWVWNNILIKSDTKFGGSQIIIEATKIEEGPVDAKLFDVPANITFSEV